MLEVCTAPGAASNNELQSARLQFDRSSSWPTSAPVCEPSLIETRSLSYAVRGRTLLHGIDQGFEAGRRTMIMGANGSGKSLLLRLMHGLLSPTQGEIVWQGRSLDRAARRSQAMVFQRPVMLRRSVLANLRFALKVRGIAGAERAEREATVIRLAQLDDLLDRPARRLSGGEQQRLALARALVCRPQLLFLDEPTASLDPASTKAIVDLILDAHAHGVTIIMVTHDPGQARRLAQDIVFLHGGKVAESGPAEQILESPCSTAVRAWLDGRIYIDSSEA